MTPGTDWIELQEMADDESAIQLVDYPEYYLTHSFDQDVRNFMSELGLAVPAVTAAKSKGYIAINTFLKH